MVFSDNTAILGRLYKVEDIPHYTTEIVNFANWSNEHSLAINVRKTEEVIFDFKLVGNQASKDMTVWLFMLLMWVLLLCSFTCSAQNSFSSRDKYNVSYISAYAGL